MRVVRKYTLTELLVVMAIMGILLGIAMPAFEKLTKGNKVTAATNSISTALGQARSLAILQRKYVALLLPSADNNLKQAYRYKSYRLCYVTQPTTGNFQFERWTDDGIWHFLPTGVILAEADADPAWNSGDFSELKDITNFIDTDIKAVAAANYSIRGLIFSPYGGLATANPIDLAITEGAHDDSAVSATFTNKDGTNPANLVKIEINRFTGRSSFL